MKHNIRAFFLCLFTACSAAGRDAEVVAAEERERQKPLLIPPGAKYFGELAITVSNFSDGLEYASGGSFMPLNTHLIRLTKSAVIRVKPQAKSELETTETYEISDSFRPPVVAPQPGSYTSPVRMTAAATFANSRIEVETGNSFVPYDAEQGILIAASRSLRLRECVATRCSEPYVYMYEIKPADENLPPGLPRELTAAEIQRFTELARNEYNQNLATGLAAQMDAAKLLVIRDNSLMPSAAMRQRFLAQNNTTAAAEACTTVARYLYTWARRIALDNRQLPAFPDFPHYYITHIVRGDITVDGAGQNYVWVANGVAPVTRYLPADALDPYEFQRGTSYPTDYSLIDKLAVTAPALSLLRDGPSGASHTHTFFAVKTPVGYAMVDTYFNAFNGVDVRASAGKAWPYAFRFGPAGSRYLHFVYGY
ncbi:MAG: hypothetical protein KF713_11710 [Turneriella sp.]|nr:hypothetical protein [Turneriella sp.]